MFREILACATCASISFSEASFAARVFLAFSNSSFEVAFLAKSSCSRLNLVFEISSATLAEFNFAS